METTNNTGNAKLLKEVAYQLERWAAESLAGGWSTHQVEPQRKLAEKIFAHLARTSQL